LEKGLNNLLLIVKLTFLFILLVSQFSSSSLDVESADMTSIFVPFVAVTGDISPIGPEGGHIVVIGVDPTDSSKIYAGTWGSGIFRSEDAGT
jgi:hypothetical protein